MSSILAAVMPAPRLPIEIREFAEPALEPDSVLLRMMYSEVCGTDVHLWHGRLAGVPYPIIPGHVSVGHADKVRGAMRAADGTLIVEGDRLVFFDVHRTCGRCHACMVTRTPGATTVIAIGAPSDRLDHGRAMGADIALDVLTTDATERLAHVRELTGGRGVDIAIEAAGSARAVEQGLDLVRDGGRYVIAGHYTNAGPSVINAHEQINRKHLEILGCWGSEVGHVVRALCLLERHHETIPWRAIGARTYVLSDLNQALADAEAMRLPKALVQPN